MTLIRVAHKQRSVMGHETCTKEREFVKVAARSQLYQPPKLQLEAVAWTPRFQNDPIHGVSAHCFVKDHLAGI